MLLELHVKNLALIEKADLEFREGLTVLSGETGAGKSILIDSINIALGARAGKEMIRTGTEYAYIELVFGIDDIRRIEAIRKMDIPIEDDGVLIISRKILPTRSIAKVNDESVTAAKLRELTGILIDMHGQFEHQSLMYPAKHLEYVDRMLPEEGCALTERIRKLYGEYAGIVSLLTETESKALREREADILRYEIDEIEKADLKEGEEQSLLEEFRKMKNASRISELLSRAAAGLEDDGISRASRAVSDAEGFDPQLKDLKEELSQIDSLIADARREIDAYRDSLDYDDAHFAETEDRLDVIHRLQGKYDIDDVEAILKLAGEKRERLDYLENYDRNREKNLRRKKELEEKLSEDCTALTGMRKEAAERLKPEVMEQLKDLNFPGVDFGIEFTALADFTPNGRDGIQFLISTNPGEPLKPMKDIASGGELSRIMLALKTIAADTDETGTLIFDEIDAGISGRTAQKVAKKLSRIGRSHQVLCISHLAQIAAMADHNCLISKSTDGKTTRTDVRQIEGEELLYELARLIGGGTAAASVLDTAREMKEIADEERTSCGI